MSDVPSVLPQGWALTTIAQIAQPASEKIEPSQCGELPYVGLEHIEGGTRRLIGHGHARDVRSTKSVFRRGDVLYGKLRPYLRKVWCAEFDGVCSTDILVYPPSEVVDSGFLAYLLASETVTEHAVQASAGINLPRVNASALGEAVVGLPPRPEQRRIVATLDEMLAFGRSAAAALDVVIRLLEQYRTSVLAAAFRGALTEEWRRAHGVADEANIASVPDTRTGEPDNMPGLPSTWRYSTVEHVAAPGTVVTYGIVVPGAHVPDGVPYVRQQDIEDGRVRLDALGRTSRAIAAKYERSALREGDVLLCIIRHLRVAIVPPGIDGANITQGTVRIRPAPFITSEYLAAYLTSPATQEWMKRCYIGMAMPRINVKDARAVPVAVPPIAEQHAIMRLVSEAVRTVDGQLEAVHRMKLELKSLEDATLAKAFRGALVPQEPADEPAATLLERLKSARLTEGSSRRGRRAVRETQRA